MSIPLKTIACWNDRVLAGETLKAIALSEKLGYDSVRRQFKAAGYKVHSTDPITTRKCSACKETKPIVEFTYMPWRSGHKAKYGYKCKQCVCEYTRDNYSLLSTEEYTRMLTDQDGKCLICRRLPGKKGLMVDHHHVTGAIRGLLCGKCNMGLGQFEDNIDFLESAINYLKSVVR